MELAKDYRAVLKHPNLVRLCLANLISWAGNAATHLALPLLVYDKTGSVSRGAFTTLAGLVGTMLGAHLLHPRLHHIHPKNLARISDFFSALGILSIYLASYSAHFDWYVYGLTVATMALMALHQNASQYILKNAVDGGNKNLALHFNAAYESTLYLGKLTGPIVITSIFFWSGVRNVLLFDALTFLGSAILLGPIQLSYTQKSENLAFQKSLKIYPSRELIFYLVLPLITGFAFSIYNATYIMHLHHTLRAPAYLISLFFGFEAFCIFVGAFLTPHWKEKPSALPIAVALAAIGYLGFYFAPNIYYFGLSDSICCLGVGLIHVRTKAQLQTLVRQEHVVSIMALRLSLYQTVQSIGMAFVGVWLIYNETTPLFLVGSGILIAAFIYTNLFAWSLPVRVEKPRLVANAK